jgi:ECF transporter S component (folate family)
MYLKRSKQIFSHPFCREYWKLACAELKDIRMLAIAAVVIAARVAIGTMVPLEIAPNLKINLSFWFVAVGAMIYGPVVGALSGAVSDTLSCALTGFEGYFFPFIFVEMLGGFLYGLVLYRRKITTWRAIEARVVVNIGCNLIVNPLVMVLYYGYLGTGSTYTIYQLSLTLFKNLLLLPFESLIMIVFLSATIPPLKAIGWIPSEQQKIYLKRSNLVVLAALFVLSLVLLILLYKTGFYDTVKTFLKNTLK